ncbi:MAG: hypothetical protein KI790_06410 [Cyclobacteriaceae bacterium]|nr:hypothetical protein [Cyclobacteriaceae bacterium HetDA_MAG_MS6]
MRKIVCCIAVISIISLMNSCKLNKMIDLPRDIDWSITPNQPQVVNGLVYFTFNASIPSHKIPSHVNYTFFFIYKYGNSSEIVGRIPVIGSLIPQNKSQSYRVSEVIQFSYKRGMENGTLYLKGEEFNLWEQKSRTSSEFYISYGLKLPI